MNKPINIIIVGGGIIGATIAATFVQDRHNISLIDMGAVGNNGSTRYSGALFRVHDPDIEIAKLTKRSVDLMKSTYVGAIFSHSLNKSGIIYAVRKNKDNLDLINRSINQFSDASYPMNIIDSDKAFEFTNGIYSKNITREILFESKGGYGDIRKTTRDLAYYIKKEGNLVLENTRVLKIGSHVGSAFVDLGGEKIEADYVILATGAWAKQLSDNLLIDTKSIPLGNIKAPNSTCIPVIDTQSGTHLVPLSGNFYQAGSKVRHSAITPEQLGDFTEEAKTDVRERLGKFGIDCDNTNIISIVSGYDSYTPDGRPIIDFVDSHKRLFTATGFCGIGYKIALAVAELTVNQIYLNNCLNDSFIGMKDKNIFSLSRFTEL
ncbi:NAD(P)/FAD-dependent oxidoreductase [Xenorhabdus siamensis]|uniref:NAD(P)/FAD-dependent oxidoreductase n=1 Tax=Xenorhabdus siamensis TaxID=3136254 RepID=UPI0030F3AA3D